MNYLFIIHFFPLELYPPVQNLLNQLIEKKKNVKIIVFTTYANTALNTINFSTEHIEVIRVGKSGKNLKPWQRYFTYLKFFTKATFSLFKYKPNSVLYYETLSSFPAVMYKKTFGKKAKLFIHYHEYTSKEQYKSGMLLNKIFHQLEKQIYPLANWVSHTNQQRMNFFLKDIAPIKITNTYAIPNYPPKIWYRSPNQEAHTPLKIIYVGSLGLNSMFIKEFANWVIQQNGNVVWDIYTINCTQEVKDFFQSLNTNYIQFQQPVNYKELPNVFQQYDVGVVLYKGVNLNQIHTTPNKMFEYFACGLDVWFPDVMLGGLEFAQLNGLQKMIPVNFLQLQNFEYKKFIRLKGNTDKVSPNHFFCEYALSALVEKL